MLLGSQLWADPPQPQASPSPYPRRAGPPEAPRARAERQKTSAAPLVVPELATDTLLAPERAKASKAEGPSYFCRLRQLSYLRRSPRMQKLHCYGHMTTPGSSGGKETPLLWPLAEHTATCVGQCRHAVFP